MTGGIVINSELYDDGINYTIVTYDYEKRALKFIKVLNGCEYGECLDFDIVYYSRHNKSIRRVTDNQILMMASELVLIYKEYLKTARDFKIYYLTTNGITFDYQNDEEAKEKFKEIAGKDAIMHLTYIENILREILKRLREYIDDKTLYHLFFINSNEGEKKHGYTR